MKEKKDEHKHTLAYYFTVATQMSGVSCVDSVVLGSLQAVLVKPLTYVRYRLVTIPVSINKVINISELLNVQNFPSQLRFCYHENASHLYQFHSTRQILYLSHL
jgi:hypothetical protein